MSLKFKQNNSNWEKEPLIYDQEEDIFYSFGIDIEQIIRNYNHTKYMVEFEIESNQAEADSLEKSLLKSTYSGRVHAYKNVLRLLTRE